MTIRSKNRTEEHGGASKRIYCVDRASYPAPCLAMAWEDPPSFGETRPNRRSIGPARCTPDFHLNLTPQKKYHDEARETTCSRMT